MQWQCTKFQQARPFQSIAWQNRWSLFDSSKILIQLLNDELFLGLTWNDWKQVNDDQTITQHSIILDKTNINGNFIFSVDHLLKIRLVPEIFLEFSPRERAAKRRMQVAKRRERKTSGYLGPESHFHADAGCQTRQIYNYKRDQWQLSNHVLISR